MGLEPTTRNAASEDLIVELRGTHIEAGKGDLRNFGEQAMAGTLVANRTQGIDMPFGLAGA